MTDTSAPEAGDAYEFTTDWLRYNVANWRKIFSENRIETILEIGSYEGRSTCWMIEVLSARTALEVSCVDSWSGGDEHQVGGRFESSMPEVERRFDRNVTIASAKAAHKVTVKKYKNLSNLGLADVIAERRAPYFDLVYVDGSHHAPDVLTDSIMAFQVLKVGGIMMFDDYLWRLDPHILNQPKIAIDSFLNVFQEKMVVMHDLTIRQLYARKIAA